MALAGVESLLLIPIKEHPERVRLQQTAIDAAVAAGVRRIVYSSFLGAAPDATFTFARHHYATEQHTGPRGGVHLPARQPLLGGPSLDHR